jgi:acetyl-CoA acyltransferase
MEGLKDLKTPFRAMGKVTAGNASGLNDGACGVLLMAADKAKELGIQPKMRMVAYTYAGVRPEVMGLGPIPATHKVFKIAGLSMTDVDLIEINEAFAVQCIAFMNEFGLEVPDEPRLNPWGGAIAIGHPLASSGPRLMVHLMHEFAENPKAKYGLATMCVGLGQGGSVIWENLQTNGKKTTKKKPATKGKKK